MNVLFLDKKRRAKKEIGFVMEVPTVPRVGECLDIGPKGQGIVLGVIWRFQCDGCQVDAIVIFK